MWWSSGVNSSGLAKGCKGRVCQSLHTFRFKPEVVLVLNY